MASDNDHETLDILNKILGDFCVKNFETYGTSIELNLRSTFKEVADFYDAFKTFEKQYNFKKENSPDFENALQMWIKEIKIKVQIERAEHKSYNPDNPQHNVFSLVSNVYWKTVSVNRDNIFNIHHNLFYREYPDKQSGSTQEYIYTLLEPKLFEIATGYVYAYKLPELEKELIELSKGKNDSKINVNETNEPLPEYEYKTAAQRIAWMHEIGILDTVINQFKYGETINSRRAANVIHSFTGIDAGTLRKCLGAIYQPGTDQKNNPLVNPENKLFVADMAARFKLNKVNKQE